jgi:hypothetical protein
MERCATRRTPGREATSKTRSRAWQAAHSARPGVEPSGSPHRTQICALGLLMGGFPREREA